MSAIDRLLAQGRVRRERGAETFRTLDSDECMLCDAYGADKRNLFIDCGYAVNEVVPEVLDIYDLELEHGRGYYLLICKSCRARLLGALQGWANQCRSLRGLAKNHDGYLDGYLDNPERNIPVRVQGATRMLTAEEFAEFRKSLDT